MNDVVEEGLVRHIGVSNFSPSLLDRARDISSAPIFTDQVQYHPYWDQRKLLDYCRIHDVLLTAYSPLARGGVLDDPALVQIGNKYGKSPAQVALRWLVQQDGVAAIRRHPAASIWKRTWRSSISNSPTRRWNGLGPVEGQDRRAVRSVAVAVLSGVPFRPDRYLYIGDVSVETGSLRILYRLSPQPWRLMWQILLITQLSLAIWSQLSCGVLPLNPGAGTHR